MYGASEVATATVLNKRQAIKKNNSVGLPCTGVKVKVVDQDLIDCKPMITGKIIVKSSLVASYYKLEKISKKSFVNDYFITGDLGYLDTITTTTTSPRYKSFIPMTTQISTYLLLLI